MKRIIAMTLILALTLAMFTGCSKTGRQCAARVHQHSIGDGKQDCLSGDLPQAAGRSGYGAVVCLHRRRTLPRGDEPERSDHAGD